MANQKSRRDQNTHFTFVIQGIVLQNDRLASNCALDFGHVNAGPGRAEATKSRPWTDGVSCDQSCKGISGADFVRWHD